MYARLTPLDTVFFRDGSPFTMGEETWGGGRFPPPPSVLYGALRTRYFAEHPAQLPNAAGDDDPTAEARLTSFHLRQDGTPLFPMPRDLVTHANKEENGSEEQAEGQDEDSDTPVVRLQQTKMPDGSAGMGSMPMVLSHRKDVESVRRSFINMSDLEDYLQGHKAPLSSKHLYDDDLVHQEPKIGIRMDRETRGAAEGFLYRVGLHRLGKNVSFGVGLEDLSLEKEGGLKIGGEGKAARYETLGGKPPVPSVPREQIAEARAFAMYLATPAIFDNGWLPSWIDPDTLRGAKGEVSVRLRSAAVGKPGAIGGWDMNEGAPKPMYRTVPAGSVYYFAVEEGTADDVARTFHNERISEERARAGFGHVFVGAVPS